MSIFRMMLVYGTSLLTFVEVWIFVHNVLHINLWGVLLIVLNPALIQNIYPITGSGHASLLPHACPDACACTKDCRKAASCTSTSAPGLEYQPPAAASYSTLICLSQTSRSAGHWVESAPLRPRPKPWPPFW